MELLTHVSKRLKSRPVVQLPIEALLSQFSSSESQPQIVVRTSLSFKVHVYYFSVVYHTELFIGLHQAGVSPSPWSRAGKDDPQPSQCSRRKNSSTARQVSLIAN